MLKLALREFPDIFNSAITLTVMGIYEFTFGSYKLNDPNPMKLLNKFLFVTLIITLAISCKKEKEDEPQTGNRPPGDFVVSVSPEENSALISWTAATDPDGDVVTYSVIVEDDTLITESVELLLSIDSLEFESAYSGSVIASDSKGFFKVVEFDFETGVFPNDPPGSFSLFSPSNNMINIPLYPNMNWGDALDPEGGAVTYDVYLGTSNPPENLVGTELSNPSFTVSIGLNAETSYYWNVIAKDGLGAETESEIFSFTTQGTAIATLITGDPGFADRISHTSLIFDNKMWVIGGATCCGGTYNDVWYSEDGVSWIMATDDAGWPARTDHTSVVYDNKMWVMGGKFNSGVGGQFNDVWYSEDGINWTVATESAAWVPRNGMDSGVIDGKMWIFGGRDALNSVIDNQAWSSVDGVNWILESDNAGVWFTQGDIVEFQNKLWKISGGYSDNIYSTENGVDWDLEFEDAPFGKRLNSATAFHDNKLWLISGSDQLINETYELPDIWYSEDGVNWVRAAEDGGFPAVASSRAVSFNGNLHLIAGGGGWQSFSVTNDVYLIE